MVVIVKEDPKALRYEVKVEGAKWPHYTSFSWTVGRKPTGLGLIYFNRIPGVWALAVRAGGDQVGWQGYQHIEPFSNQGTAVVTVYYK